jgi:hypothetical protein
MSATYDDLPLSEHIVEVSYETPLERNDGPGEAGVQKDYMTDNGHGSIIYIVIHVSRVLTERARRL